MYSNTGIVLVRVLQSNRTSRRYVCRYKRSFIPRNQCMWLWKLRSPTICCGTPADPGKPWIGSVQSPASEGQTSRGPGLYIPVQGREKICEIPQLNGEGGERDEALLPPLFALFKFSVDWIMPNHIGEGNLLYWIHWLKCYLIQKHLPRHTQK